jgi:putative ABC transport system ATP-binding protein
MDKSLFRYIWRHSKRDQLIIFAVVLASLPFYFASLDLPRRIVNEAIQGRAFQSGQTTAQFLSVSIPWPEWLGGAGSIQLFEGFQVDRLGLLFGLSGVFLLLVLVNGAFKYAINVSKGALGERMLRRMRFDLFGLVLRFSPEALRTVKSSETATIIKDEVEPIGGFIGDAVHPARVLGHKPPTALFFILIQKCGSGSSPRCGPGSSFTIIPRAAPGTPAPWKAAPDRVPAPGGRVARWLRHRGCPRPPNALPGSGPRSAAASTTSSISASASFRRSSWSNSEQLLAQITPFFSTRLAGISPEKGSLDFGQLVAWSPPIASAAAAVKELIDWDQMRLDVQVKYDQVVQHFSAERLLPAEPPRPPPRISTSRGR